MSEMTVVRAEQPDMPDYGVGAPGWEPLPWSWAAERLTGYRNFWVVTVSGAGRPHALPVWGVWWDEEHRFAFGCAPGARKARNLAANARVVVGGDDTIECISIEGGAVAVDSGPRREEWIRRYLDKYQALAPELDADFLRRNRLVEVTPERAFGIVERTEEFSTRATRWVFEPPAQA